MPNVSSRTPVADCAATARDRASLYSLSFSCSADAQLAGGLRFASVSERPDGVIATGGAAELLAGFVAMTGGPAVEWLTGET